MGSLKLPAGILLCLWGISCLPAQDSDSQKQAKNPTTEELLERIEKLESRIAELEQKSRSKLVRPTLALPQKGPQLTPPAWAPDGRNQPVPTFPAPAPAPLAEPPHWHKGLINGQPFYIVPATKELANPRPIR